MKRSLAAFPLVVLGLASVATAQVKVIPGDTVTLSGTVEAIDHTSRALTLKTESGELVALDVAAEAKRFPEIKVGDKITARYYDNVTVRLKKPDEPSVDTATGRDPRQGGQARCDRRQPAQHDGRGRGH